MNIEESIKPLRILMSKYKQIDEMNNFNHELALVIDYTELSAIEILLTAYEKEKEKREKLEYEAEEAEEYIKELKKYIEKYKIRIPMPEEYYNRENWGEEITIAQKEYIAVDKIKAKIEEINKEMLNEENSLELFYRKKYCKEVLQSLLEKE